MSINSRFRNLLVELRSNPLTQNFGFLLINNGLNLLAPAISIGYIFNIIGAEKFAFISFSTAMIGLLSFFVEYGFITSMVRRVSLNKHDSDKLNEIIFSTIFLKSFLCIVMLILLGFFLYYINPFKEFNHIIILTSGLLVGQALNINYVYLGLKETRILTSVNMFSKISTLLLVLLFIRSENQYLNWPIIYSLISVITSVVLILIIIYKYKLTLTYPSKPSIIFALRDGFHIFSVNLSGSVLLYGPTVLLGYISSKTVLGYFGLADRLSNLISVVFLSISQAILPNLSILISKQNTLMFTKYFWNVMKYSALTLILGYFIFLLSIDQILIYFRKTDIENITFILKYVGLYTIIVSLNTAAFPFLVSLNLDKKLALNYTLMASFFLISMGIIKYYSFEYNYLIYSLIFTQFSIFAFNLYSIGKEVTKH